MKALYRGNKPCRPYWRNWKRCSGSSEHVKFFLVSKGNPGKVNFEDYRNVKQENWDQGSQVLLFFVGIYILLWYAIKFIAIDLPPIKATYAILSQALQIAGLQVSVNQ